MIDAERNRTKGSGRRKTVNSGKRQGLLILFTAVCLVGAALILRSPAGGTIGVSASTLKVLHFQGNTEDVGSNGSACAGNGAADIVNCNGPLLNENAVLSTGPAARWGPVSPALNGTNARSIYDPNWIWQPSAPQRLGGAVKVEWWASCGACAAGVTNANWLIKIYNSTATGAVPAYQITVAATPSAPNVAEKLTADFFVPEINVTDVMVLTIDPVFIDAQENSNIYYDSLLPCPGATSGPCDSKMTLTVLAAGEPVPTPLGGAAGMIAPPSACALPTFDNYQPPVNLPGTTTPYTRRDSAGEPSIGINWNTGNVMTMARLTGNRTAFDDSTSPADPNTGASWYPRAMPTVVTGLDPIGFTDSVTGRSLFGELNGNFTNGIVSDDDFATFTPLPTQGISPTSSVDHQTIGGGPPNPSVLGRQPTGSYPHLFYYAAQDTATATVATSFDGGFTYQPATPAYTLAQCGGLHGHIKVAPDGTVYLPNKGCGGKVGFAVSVDNGLNWTVRTVPTSTSGRTDPSVGIGTGGRVFLGYTDSNNRPRVATSDDKGINWRNDYDLSLSLPKNLTASAFVHSVAGDNNRAAVFFIATDSTSPGNPVGDDATTIFSGTWYPYIATTCDGGISWSVIRADNDPLHPGVANPVQQGVVCTIGTTCPAGPPATRNLLDFNELVVDSRGRITAVYADGCNFDHPCINVTDNSANKSQNQGSARLTIIRQRGGMRLFSAFDPSGPAAPMLSPPISVEQQADGYQVGWATPDDGGSALTGYRIYRGSADDNLKLIAEVGAGQNNYRDRLPKLGKDVYYSITAVNQYGESPRSIKIAPKRG